MKKFADKHKTKRVFTPGELVYTKMQNHREKALGVGNPGKISSKWYGPFIIIKAVGNRAY
jgi:hypothetical protein